MAGSYRDKRRVQLNHLCLNRQGSAYWRILLQSLQLERRLLLRRRSLRPRPITRAPHWRNASRQKLPKPIICSPSVFACSPSVFGIARAISLDRCTEAGPHSTRSSLGYADPLTKEQWEIHRAAQLDLPVHHRQADSNPQCCKWTGREYRGKEGDGGPARQDGRPTGPYT